MKPTHCPLCGLELIFNKIYFNCSCSYFIYFNSKHQLNLQGVKINNNQVVYVNYSDKSVSLYDPDTDCYYLEHEGILDLKDAIVWAEKQIKLLNF